MLATWACSGAPEIDRPNIVLMLGDDHGYPHYGFMGSEAVRTPHLDSLAETGALFTHAHNTASVCRPSQLTYLTGLHPYRWDGLLSQLRGRKQRRAIERVETLPRLLATRGYVSFQGGKYWEGNFTMGGFTHGMAKTGPLATNQPLQAQNHGRRLMKPVLQFIDAHAEEPFFVWFAPSIPHTPFTSTAEIKRLYRDDDVHGQLKRYYEACTHYDSLVGQLVRFLDERQLREKTILVYASDNGFEPGSKPGDPNPRGKSSLHELGFRTPLILNWPGHIRGGRRSDELISTIDLVPTLLDYAGLDPVDHLRGESLRPRIDGSFRAADELIVGSLRARANTNEAEAERGFYVRSPRWHFISEPDGSRRLYDKTSDPDENVNVAEEHPEVVTRSLGEIERWKSEAGDPIPLR